MHRFNLSLILVTSLGTLGFGSVVEAAQETETKKVEARGLSFEIPTTWKTRKPSSQMRVLEISIDPVRGDDEPALIAIFAFPGGAGSVSANVQRWQSQFTDANGANPAIKSETVDATGGQKVTFVETAGRYRTSFPNQVDEEGYRLLGGILPTNNVGYFIKLVGPDATVKAARPAFKKMLESINLDR